MSDLKIFGEHDDKTVAQMRRCMGTGSASAGVLCADGHLGYAHPIGGVVGYTAHISISGVGFDIACGNMAVKLDTPCALIKDQVGPNSCRYFEGGQLRRRPHQRRTRRTRSLRQSPVG